MIRLCMGILLIFTGGLFTWISLISLIRNRVKPRQRIDPSVFAVMDLQVQDYRPRVLPVNIHTKGRKDSLNLETTLNEGDGSPSPALFGNSFRTNDSVNDSPPSVLRMRSLDKDKDGESKTLGL